MVGVLASSAAYAADADGRADWVAESGDHVMVDTDASIIYLVHGDGTFISFNGLTGQHRNVCYIGRCYYAATPTGSWIVKDVERKGRSTTFGDGRFLRLNDADGTGGDDGQGRTAYGIHSHAQFTQMLDDKIEKKGFDKEGKGYRSYGCILLSEDDLSLVEASFNANGGQIAVETGPDLAPPPAPQGIAAIPSWLGIQW